LLNDKGYAQLQADYNAKDKEVKKLCKGYKTRWIESKLQETKTAAAMQLKVTQRLYRIVRELSGKSRRQMAPVRKLDGSLARTHAEQHQCWQQHFKEVLRYPEPVITHDFSTDDVIQLDTDTVPITYNEVRKAITNLKNGKAAATDGIQAQLIKAGGETVVATLTELYNKVCFIIPADWKNSMIVPTSRFILSASPFLSQFTSSSTCQPISLIIPALVIHHSLTLSLQAQNLPFQQILPTLDFFYLLDCLTIMGLDQTYHAHRFIFSFIF